MARGNDMSAKLFRYLYLLVVFLPAYTASAHEVRPAYLELREEKPGQFAVTCKTPMLGDARLALEPEFSGDAKAVTPMTTHKVAGAAEQTWTLRAQALLGRTVRVRGLEGTMTDAMVRMEFADGTSLTERL